MLIPDFQSLMLPILEYYGDKLEHGSLDALGHLKEKFAESLYDLLTREDREFVRHISTATNVSFTPGR